MARKSPLKTYIKATHKGELSDTGLCVQFGARQILLVSPTQEDVEELEDEGKNPHWWGYDTPIGGRGYSDHDRYFKLTELRQTILLLMAAMEGEL